MRDTASIIVTTAFVVYALPFLVFGLVSSMQSANQRLRQFMALGPVLGLSLGACIAFGLYGIWLENGEFSWQQSSDVQITTQVVFFVMWISNMIFEIWTLEPARKQQPLSGPTFQKIRRHLWLHCGLIIAVAAISLQT